MRAFWSMVVLNAGAILAAMPANACFMNAATDLHDVDYAEIVVVGRIVNYEIIRDPVMRERRQHARVPNARDIVGEDAGFITDYARFHILVDEVLRGKAHAKMTVTWDNSTFGEPAEMRPGSYLIALRDPKSLLPPLRGPSATVFPNKEPAFMTVLQAPCASAFIFESTSEQATRLRQMLETKPMKLHAD